MEIDKTIEQLYTRPSNPGSFSGISGFLKSNKNIKKKDFLNYLKNTEAYTLHKPKTKKFGRKRVIVPSIDHTWQIDLLDVSKIRDENEGFNYLFVCIDCFSKKAWVVKMKNKNSASSVSAFKTILKVSKRKPLKIQADKGSEFFNKEFKKLCYDNKIHLYSTFSELKACIVERFNRTLREKMQRYFTFKDSNRYIEVLDDIVSSYNNSYHRSIKQTPNSVTKEDESKIFLNLYKYDKQDGPKCEIKIRLKINDKVRISKSKTTFEKGYAPNWTIEYFFIKKILPTSPPTFILQDLLGEELSGSFYEKELQKVEQKDEVFRIENILDSKYINKKKFVLIKWLGWPEKFNSWEPASNLKK
jgi:hypothetical protein